MFSEFFQTEKSLRSDRLRYRNKRPVLYKYAETEVFSAYLYSEEMTRERSKGQVFGNGARGIKEFLRKFAIRNQDAVGMIRYWLLAVFLLFSTSTYASYDKETEAVLRELDKTIARKAVYQKEKATELARLRNKLLHADNDALRSACAYELANAYLHFQADSSLHYLNLHERFYKQAYPDKENWQAVIMRAMVMGIMGMYNEALEALKQVPAPPEDIELRRSYYRAFRAYYGWLADYTVTDKERYLTQMDAYRDSILQYSQSDTEKYISTADKMIMYHKPKDAIELLNLVPVNTAGMQNQAYLYYTYQAAYESLGERHRQIYYLARTAITDIKMAVREYAALQKLAFLIYEDGDIERAYRYLSCAMQDAIACHTHLRTLEATKIFPIIDKAYTQEREQKTVFEQRLLIAISILAFFFIVAAAYFYYWMKKLAAMRRNLYYTNKKLNRLNADLEQTGKIKEVYIARYLEKCVSYIDKLEQYRRSLEKLAMASKIDELYKVIKSEQFLKEERKNFYTEFDRSFMELFPHFIDDFNALLTEDAEIIPKSYEILNTELRIFALIRLGITDASQIAHFLGYSLATVYNYRSKIRNKARGDKDKFEDAVMRL